MAWWAQPGGREGRAHFKVGMVLLGGNSKREWVVRLSQGTQVQYKLWLVVSAG